MRPIELQTMIPGSMDVQKIQEINQTRPNLAQHDFARELMQQTQLRQKQIEKSSSSSEGNKISRDKSESEKRESKKRHFNGNSQEETETEAELIDTERGQHIDVKI